MANADVTVVDSFFIDQAMKFQVTEAAKLAKEGASLEEILAKIEEVKEKTELYMHRRVRILRRYSPRARCRILFC